MNVLADRIRDGDARALARGLTLVENRAPEADDLLAALHSTDRDSLCIGFTGAPGVGKSTLVDHVATQLRQEGRTVAVLAIDPSSPFTGGAVLGDRVRMQRHHDDPHLFIRSMASRGDLGGLAPAVSDALTLLEASHHDAILIETAGVGQSEVDVMHVATTVAVLLTPGLGDDVQAAKAGIMEIADLFVINKSDLPGADELERQLLAMISLIPDESAKPPVLRTSAIRGEGVPELVSALRNAGSPSRSADYWKWRMIEKISSEIRTGLGPGGDFGLDLDCAAEDVAAGRLNPHAYIKQVLGQLRKNWKR